MPTHDTLHSAEEDMTKEQLLSIISHLRAELAHYRRPVSQASASSSAPQASPTSASLCGAGPSPPVPTGEVYQSHTVRHGQPSHASLGRRIYGAHYSDDDSSSDSPPLGAALAVATAAARTAGTIPATTPPTASWAPPPPPLPQHLQAIPQGIPQGIPERALNADFSRPQLPAGIGEPGWYEYNSDQQGWLCKLCRKYVTREHLVSQMHTRRAADPEWYMDQ